MRCTFIKGLRHRISTRHLTFLPGGRDRTRFTTWSKDRERSAVALDPREFDWEADTDVFEGAVDDGAAETNTVEPVEFDRDNGMRSLRIVDIRCRSPLMKVHRKMNHTLSRNLGRRETIRPTPRANRLRRMMIFRTIIAAIDQ